MGDTEEVRDDAQDLAGDSDETKGNEDPNFLDEVIIQGLDDEDGEEEDKSPADKKPAEKTPADDPLVKAQADIDRLNRKVTDLNKALHEERKSKKEAAKSKDEEPPKVTRTELKKLYEEYKDDPDTMFQLIEYVAAEAAKGASKDAISRNKVTDNRKEIDGYLQQNFPDLYTDASELRRAVDKTKSEMGFDDHPYGDFVGTAIQTMLNLPHLAKKYYDQGRSDANSGKAEKKRQELVKDGSLTPKGKGNAGTDVKGLQGKHLEVANRLELSPSARKILEKMTSKGAVSTVNVEG